MSEAREEERRSRTEAGVALSAKRCRSLRVCERDNSEWDARICQCVIISSHSPFFALAGNTTGSSRDPRERCETHHALGTTLCLERLLRYSEVILVA